MCDTQASAQVRAVPTVCTCNLKGWGHLDHLGLLVWLSQKLPPSVVSGVFLPSLTLDILWWQRTRVGTRADTGGERMCEVQPEWNVREDHSDRAGTLFVLIASREGKQQPVLPRCFLSVFYVFLSWLLSRMNITLFYPSSWIICSIWGEGRGGGRQATVRRAQVQALLEEYHVAAFYDLFNTRELNTAIYPAAHDTVWMR